MQKSIQGLERQSVHTEALALHAAGLDLILTPHVVPQVHQDLSLSTVRCAQKNGKEKRKFILGAGDVVEWEKHLP